MDPTTYHDRNRRKRGQTLAEFAFTLPILLMLIFGIIEFGRIFQAWVSLQNSARAAARYASTGKVNYDIFNEIEESVNPLDLRVLNSIVPCGENSAGVSDISQTPVIDPASGVATYSGHDEVFANWYDGTDCDPTLEDHQQLRRDLLRLFSVMHEARESVNALGAEWRDASAHYFEALAPDYSYDLLKEYWSPEFARQNVSQWFNITICSARGFIDPLSKSLHTDPLYANSRFVLIRSESDLAGLPPGSYPHTESYMMPFCMLNEVPPPPANGQPDHALRNASHRWLDAGGPGDRVTIVITFNHPLITPLRLDEDNYITMQARRSIINESFRAPKSMSQPGRSIAPGTGHVGTLEPTLTPTDTETPVDTPTEPGPATLTSTPTPKAFTCENITVGWGSPPFISNRMYYIVNNSNDHQIQLMRTNLNWRTLDNPNNNMYIGTMALNNIVHWTGAPANHTYQNNTTGIDTGTIESDAGGRLVQPNGSAIWEALFFNGPSSLVDHMTLYDFEGTITFVQRLPDGNNGMTCVVPLTRPDNMPDPTDPPPPTVGPTPTNTPDCINTSQHIRMEFGGFTSFGGVYFNIINNSGRDLIMTGFNLTWPDRNHKDIQKNNNYYLSRVILGGEEVISPDGQLVWEGNVTTGNTRTVKPYTRTDSQAHPQWLSEGTIPPGTTRLWMDFDGYGGTLNTIGARDHHFDDSVIRFACRTSGPGGGPGIDQTGSINLPIPSPMPTNTPRPTSTRGPTNTPLPPTPVRTATRTPTKRPATATRTPMPPTYTPTRAGIGVPTPRPGGGGE